MRLAALLAALLAGCVQPAYVKVRFVHVERAHLAAACPRLVGHYLGCVVQTGEVAEIRAPRPRDVRDARAMEVIGHEFYCHAWLRQHHEDARGVRRDPDEDCVQ